MLCRWFAVGKWWMDQRVSLRYYILLSSAIFFPPLLGLLVLSKQWNDPNGFSNAINAKRKWIGRVRRATTRCLHLINFYYFNDLLRRTDDRGQTPFLLLSMMLGLRSVGRFVAVPIAAIITVNGNGWYLEPINQPGNDESLWKTI